MSDEGARRPSPHWGHYAIEAWGLGSFMFVAGATAAAIAALPQPAHAWLATHPLPARALFGSVMGATAIAIVYSPWGMRSGAHLNPAVTTTFAVLGKIDVRDAVWYVAAQFAGGLAGFAAAALVFGRLLLGPPSNAIVTKPGAAGVIAAFVAEAAITFLLMSTVLRLSNAPPRVARFTGVAAGMLVAAFITFEAPLSGMSMNPARTLASALIGGDLSSVWLYFVAPPLGMLLAAFVYVKTAGRRAVRCARIALHGRHPCIFRCTYLKTYGG